MDTSQPVKQEDDFSQNDFTENKSFPIVGVGGSAGGIEAFTELLQHLNAGMGMTYVLVMHLSPKHKSALAHILQPHTQMQVLTVTDGMKVLPDHVYVIPPNTFMSLVDGHFALAPREVTAIGNFAIDYFMIALASRYRNNSIGVILSGTATDGTLGMKAIKAEGGITFAQDESAKFPGMPRNAFDAGYADFLMSPPEIAADLRRIYRLRYTQSSIESIGSAREARFSEDQHELKKVLAIVRNKFGVDFFLNYKHASVTRRIARRMVLRGIETLAAYALLLKSNSREVDALYDDLLINVTEFFRDADFFDLLRKEVFPALIKDRNPLDPIRVWIAGCSTGEEAYSIAICLIEYLGENELTIPIQIFASDLDIGAIDKARLGRYPISSLHGISPEQLKKYMHKVDGEYQIKKFVRELCVFSKHNLLQDPPFSRLDLVSCQNVLIYLETGPQSRILQTFHYALKPSGYLCLGKSETVGTAAEHFDQIDKKAKLFKRNLQKSALSGLDPDSKNGVLSSVRNQMEKKIDTGIDNEIGRLLLAKYVTPAILVNKTLAILQFFGPISPYLEPVTGKASLNVLKIIREDLVIYLRSLIYEAVKTEIVTVKENISVSRNQIHQEITIEVVPKRDVSGEMLFLVVFKENTVSRIAPIGHNGSSLESSADSKDKAITKLQAQLSESRGLIRASNEEYEATYEELQAYNEEILSTNEELQSVNEELETSKEELQSAIEELTTTNDELRIRNNELNESHSYAQAIVETIASPMLVLTANYHVRLANSAFYRTFNVAHADVEGQTFFEMAAHAFDIPVLHEQLAQLPKRNSHYHEFELSHSFPGAGDLSFQVHAYMFDNNNNSSERLILLAFNNVTELIKANRELVKANEQIAEFVFVSSHHLQEPIRKIQIFADYLGQAEANLNDFSRHFLKKINYSSTRILTLVRDLTSFTEVTHGGKERSPINLNETLSSIIENLELEIRSKKSVVNLSKLPVVIGNPIRITQLFHNLVENALKFGKEDLVINVSSAELSKADVGKNGLDKQKQYVAVSVADNGIGFSPTFIPKIFGLFQQLNTIKDLDGTGVGLAICKRIAEDHGGALLAEGAENKGATFTVILPV